MNAASISDTAKAFLMGSKCFDFTHKGVNFSFQEPSLEQISDIVESQEKSKGGNIMIKTLEVLKSTQVSGPDIENVGGITQMVVTSSYLRWLSSFI